MVIRIVVTCSDNPNGKVEPDQVRRTRVNWSPLTCPLQHPTVGLPPSDSHQMIQSLGTACRWQPKKPSFIPRPFSWATVIFSIRMPGRTSLHWHTRSVINVPRWAHWHGFKTPLQPRAAGRNSRSIGCEWGQNKSQKSKQMRDT